ncbi:MAG: histidine--tRNA ligase [Chloroflexi bacterium]|nr:histidine--tRNA ligase [Chloroflexota bacterium]
MFTAPRGTIDILPEDQPYWRFLNRTIDEVTAIFGYQRIDVPIFEETSLYVRGVGEGTDIVDKEMYSFKDKGDRDLTLRPEFTAGIVRAYLQHGMKTLPQPVRLHTTGPIFRYERVQAGRYRQHTQFDIEALGELDPALDAEIISLAWHLYGRIGFKNLALQLNSIGCPQCRPAYMQALLAYYGSHLSEICPDCQRRLERNPLRVLDCKSEQCQPIIAGAPHSQDYLCEECREHLAALCRYLDLLGRSYTMNHRLVRGLDYYTKTVFEVWAQGIGAQNAVCGGGRYDGLAELLGGSHTPAIGFGSGMERLVLTMKEQGIVIPEVTTPQVALVYLGDEAKIQAIELLDALRLAGIACSFEFGDRSLKAQMRAANREGVRLALIIGADEVAAKQVTLQQMQAEGALQRIAQADAIHTVKQLLIRGSS